MRSLIFDTGPIISLATNNLLWLLDDLKAKYKGEFYIPRYVENELVTRPLQINRFKFEALQVMYHMEKGTLKLVGTAPITELTNKIINIANQCFSAKGHWIQLVHPGEIEALAATIILEADALVIDERITRNLIENPRELIDFMQNKLHTKISINDENLKKFQQLTKNVKVLRSVELVTTAYELGLLDKYKPKTTDADEILLDSVLWGLKLRGCSISRNEIERIIKIETK